MSWRTDWRRGLAMAATLLVVTLTPFAAEASGRGDPRQEREQVRQRQAEVAAEVDVLRAEQSEVESALDALEASVAGQRAALEDAQRAAEAAAAAAAQALAEEAAAEQALADLRAAMREVAVRAYVRPGGDAGFELLESENISEAVARRALIDFRAGRDADALDRLRAAEEDLSIKRAAADEASQVAVERQAAVDGRLRELEAAEAQHRELSAQVANRVEASLAEAAHLASVDAELAKKIEEENRRLAARAPAAGSGARIPLSGNIRTVTVRGIQVNADIADQLEAMLAAAERDGLTLSGGGYRDPAAQLALREAHCPDAWNSPPSSCRPPTARPGHSMHELGLAVDFTCSGSLITSRENVCFRWLAANAASYGFYNLPSEPWHWSTNGQ